MVRLYVRRLSAIHKEVELREELSMPGGADSATECSTTRVFIIHGHDHEAALELQKLVNTEFASVHAVMYEDEADTSLSVKQNLERMIDASVFAFALLTPDDPLNKDGEAYLQARPNVTIELGWFYGKLGTRGAAIVCRTGTKVPSDIAEMHRIEYSQRVKEAFVDIKKALANAGVLGE